MSRSSNDLVAMRYDANKRSALLAYLLWFFLGWFGIHRFYLKRAGSGLIILVLALISVPLTVVLIGYVGFAILGLWWCIDALLIPGMVQSYNNGLLADLTGA